MMPEVSDWLRSGVPPVQPLDATALVRRADDVRRRRRRTRIATTTAASLACLAGAVLLVRLPGSDPGDVAVTGPGSSSEGDGPCAETGVGPVTWPGVEVSASDDAAKLGAELSTSVLGLDGTSRGVTDTDSGCLVVVDHGSAGNAHVHVQTAGDQLVVSGYAFPAERDDSDAGLGLSVLGSTVDVALERTACHTCAGRLAVRYGDAQAEGLLDPLGEGQVTIDRDTTAPGAVLITVFGTDGAIVEAVGVSIPPGDFAAG
jgi:hypothetical protein